MVDFIIRYISISVQNLVTLAMNFTNNAINSSFTVISPSRGWLSNSKQTGIAVLEDEYLLPERKLRRSLRLVKVTRRQETVCGQAGLYIDIYIYI